MSMPRYLTAQKISLLVLIRLYCDCSFPSSATIPVLSFILSSNHPQVSISARTRGSPVPRDDSTSSIHTFEDVLQAHISNMPGRTLLDLFLKHMWEINSFDALHALFDNILELISSFPPDSSDDGMPDHIYLSRTSPLGVFVRKAHLEFSRLQFDDSMKLWSSFIQYRAPTAQWTKRLAGLASSGVDAVASEMGLRPGDDIYEIAYGHREYHSNDNEDRSLDDLDRLLDFQLDRLQRFGDRIPDSMKAQLRNMVSSSSTAYRQAHLVQFLDAWKARDYTSSFDNLHRYYDYAMQTREKIHYQYALLHMAILQADFGCFGEAIAAITETIATARENQDMNCLSFSLSWLNHIAKAYPKQMTGAGYMNMLGTERDALAFLKAKARETKMYNLLSNSLLSEANGHLATGDSVTRALEHLYQSSHLNIKEQVHTYGGQMLLMSTLYSRLGLQHMANIHCQLLTDCYVQLCPVDERVRAIGHQAVMLSQSGQYDQATAILAAVAASVHKSLNFYQYVFLCTSIVKFRKAIRRSDWRTCAQLLQFLQPSADSISEPLDPELCFLQHDAYIEYLLARSSYSKAFEAISSLTRSLKNDNTDVLHRVSLLLMKAELFQRMGQPERGFSAALRAASVSFKARLQSCLWSSVGLLGNILNSLGEYTSAKRLLESILPQALEGPDILLTGRLYSHLADSYMGMADPQCNSAKRASHGSLFSIPSSRVRAAHIAKAELYIDRTRVCYKKVGHLAGECEQLMKKAILAKLRGDEKLAEEWAQNHNRVWEEGTRSIESEA
ncbi:APC5 protein [Coniothyrium glycines]